MLRFLWPILMMFGPQLGPRIVKFVRALWRLHRDSRVNLLIKLLIPLAVIYAIFPVDLVRDRIPYGLGRYDDLIISWGWRSGCSGTSAPAPSSASTWANRRHHGRKTAIQTAWLTERPAPPTTVRINAAVDHPQAPPILTL